MSAAKKQQLSDNPEVLRQIIADQAKRIAVLEELVRLQQLKRFGASSEKFPDQQEMFNEAELTVAAEEALAEQEAQRSALSEASGVPEQKPGRKPLPPELPRVRIEHDLPEGEKVCVCGCQRECIGEETSEQLDIIPAKVRVLVNARKKYACRRCENGVTTGVTSASADSKEQRQRRLVGTCGCIKVPGCAAATSPRASSGAQRC